VGLTTSRRVGSDEAKGSAAAARPDSAATAAPSTARRTRASAEGATRDTTDLLAVTSPGASDEIPTALPGSHFDALLDRTHWLTYGYDVPRLTALVSGEAFLTLTRQGTNVAVFPPSGPIRRAGFTWPGNTERLLRNTALVIEEPLGQGHVVLFANEPMFRGWWRAMDRLVLNAVLLGPSF
jgi:hypothetical protein